MRIRHLLPALLILLLATTLTAAQSGGGYDLNWSTIDGGGHTWSDGGSYTLGGSMGQPDAGVPHTGGEYSLQDGFWHPVCRPLAMTVTISCTGDQVTLDWIPDPAIKAYSVHRATSPYQEVDPMHAEATVLTPPWTDSDLNTCSDTANNYYYVVRSVCVGAHVDAGERAEFDFAIVPGTS